MTYETRFTADQLQLIVDSIDWRIAILDSGGEVDARLWDVRRTAIAAHEAQCVYERELGNRQVQSPFGPVRSFRLYRK